MTGIQDTSNKTFRQLLGNGLTYEIPKFQRDYSWSPEQWDDLWQDLLAVRSGEDVPHYMGYLVLQTSNNKRFQVIDGQQRLTTLSILVLAVLKCFQELIDGGQDAHSNRRRQDALRNSYIGYLDPVTLMPSNKLILNRNNDDYYRTYLVPLAQPRVRGINASERLMKNCHQWFLERVRRTFQTGEALAEFVDSMVDKLIFTVITVGDDLNAFKVFETLNARGVQLSSADLLKNYLFSVVDSDSSHPSELTEIERHWSRVMSILGQERFEEFLRTYWNSLNSNVRKNELFKVIRKHIRNKAQAFALLRELGESADIYMALRSPEDELWKGKPDIAELLGELRMYQVRQHLPLLLAAYRDLPLSGFQEVLKAASIISLRYNVIGGLNPNEQDRVYNDVALRIHREKRFELSWLREIYPDDDSFETEFSNKIFKDTSRNNRIVKYLLVGIEQKRHGGYMDVDGYTIEHILPESPDASWDVDDDLLERCVYRLGNLTLLEMSLNRAAGNGSYGAKKALFAQSTIGITRAIPEHYQEWGEEQITRRQKQMAKFAKEIWRLRM
jgi:hypothetical protein